MAFFDKIGRMAKDAGSKASEMLETTKLTNKIHEEEKAISELKAQLGEVYLQQHLSGAQATPEGAALCGQIQERLNNIAALEGEIQAIKSASEQSAAEKAAAEKASEEAKAAEAASAGQYVCACGAVVPTGMRFCSRCGAKVEPKPQPEAPQAPAASQCAQCGAELAPGAKFCVECGAKVAPPAPALCPQCGASLAPGAKFCVECGCKIQ